MRGNGAAWAQEKAVRYLDAWIEIAGLNIDATSIGWFDSCFLLWASTIKDKSVPKCRTLPMIHFVIHIAHARLPGRGFGDSPFTRRLHPERALPTPRCLIPQRKVRRLMERRVAARVLRRTRG